ncbi:MAG: cell division protein SepF [Lachnospiraceae bacterium]|nr:cell division protein SepF [Lachnospiraceae bacterium]MBP3610107.1 cell division protein SepF [Lachnospiraceae bacterium]
MGKIIESILDRLKLTEEEDYEDDYDEEEPVVRRRTSFQNERNESTLAAAREQAAPQPPKRFEARPMRSAQMKPSSYEEPEEAAEPQPRRVPRQERQPVPMRSAVASGMELMLRQPESFDDSQEICDLLKQERVVILNLENVDRETAQKMMDFISGAIYALDAKIHQISNSVFCISPAKVDISGDYFAMISETAGFKIPNMLNK